MDDISNWTLVDVFTVRQAAALWCNVDPSSLPTGVIFFNQVPSEVDAIEQMLTGAIVTRTLVPANSATDPLQRIGKLDNALLTRTDLEEFASSKKVFPAFLFDTLMPFGSQKTGSTPKKQARNKGGRPAEYDWDAFTIEIIRIADLPDGLPEKQADLVNMMIEWFSRTYDGEPAESAVKQRISKIYNTIRKGKNPKD
jgi:hypothetical protein